jgi:hypothetical protein
VLRENGGLNENWLPPLFIARLDPETKGPFMIDLTRASFVGPGSRDLLGGENLPHDLRKLLMSTNGFVVFEGGLHVRGVCDRPDWHSLERVWTGNDGLTSLFSAVLPADIPFAEDFIGDQFLLRKGSVVRLCGETGEAHEIGTSLDEFLCSASEDPDGFLSLNLLRQFQRGGGTLEPGKLLSAYPPLCTKESAKGVSLRSIPALERIRFLADFSRQIADLPEGTSIRPKFT